MNLMKFRHKGLQRFYADDIRKGLPTALAKKAAQSLLIAMVTAENLKQVGRFPGWKLHALKVDLEGCRSLTVTGSWRIVFRFDEEANTASDIDLTDYH